MNKKNPLQLSINYMHINLINMEISDGDAEQDSDDDFQELLPPINAVEASIEEDCASRPVVEYEERQSLY